MYLNDEAGKIKSIKKLGQESFALILNTIDIHYRKEHSSTWREDARVMAAAYALYNIEVENLKYNPEKQELVIRKIEYMYDAMKK